jgi:hypothetical protein
MRFNPPPEFRYALLRFLFGAALAAFGCAVTAGLLWNVSSLRLFEYLDVPLHLFGGLGAGILILLTNLQERRHIRDWCQGGGMAERDGRRLDHQSPTPRHPDWKQFLG